MPPPRKVRRRSARPRRSLNLLAILIPVGIVMVLGLSIFVYLLQHDQPDAAPFIPAAPANLTHVPAPAPPSPANIAIKLPPRPTNHPPASLAEVLLAFQNQQGGPKAREELKTLRLTGNLTVNDRTFALEILRKDPDLYRVQMEDRVGRLIVGGDSRKAWVAYRESGGRLAVWLVEGPTLDWLRLLAPFGSALMTDPAKPDNLAIGEKIPGTNNAPACWPVTFAFTTDRKLTYLLDDQKFLPRRLELGGTSIAQPRVADFDDWQAVSGITLPKKITVQGGGLPVTITVDRLQFNSGVLNAAFQAPVADAPAKASGPLASAPQSPSLVQYGFPWVWPW
jgi:hypothetical protein